MYLNEPYHAFLKILRSSRTHARLSLSNLEEWVCIQNLSYVCGEPCREENIRIKVRYSTLHAVVNHDQCIHDHLPSKYIAFTGFDTNLL